MGIISVPPRSAQAYRVMISESIAAVKTIVMENHRVAMNEISVCLNIVTMK